MGSQHTTQSTDSNSLANAQRIWQAALGDLQLQMTRATFDTWLQGSRVVAYEDQVLTVFVRHAYAVDWLENRLLPVIQRTLRRLAGPDVTVTFTTRTADPEESLLLVPESVPDDVAVSTPVHPSATDDQPSSTLHPLYTFDSFVVGAGNRLAHAACLAVAEHLAQAYNPLFIYGGVGLGKTHLLHALGNCVQASGLAVLYVSSEWFTNDLIHSIRAQQTAEFRAKYRSIDLLLVDDIQFIAGKERTQEEFFHTFNTLHHAGKQIVVSCDRPPRALVALEDRLRSRFGWGLIADIQPPDFETRMAILRAKAEQVPEQVPAEVLSQIARKIPSNIRELEGALNRVLAYSRLMRVGLNLDTTRRALDGILNRGVDLSPQQILQSVARHFKLKPDQLTGRSRARAVSVPRQLTMYLIREETEASLPQIGQLLGGRDHTTIMHGCATIGARLETDDQLRRDWLAIRQTLAEATEKD